MGRRTKLILKDIRLEKLVHGGQAIAKGPDGRKLLVWGGLPGELVNVRVYKKKKTFYEGAVSEVTEKSKHRIDPAEPESYLSTSPWQILSYDLENKAKQEILEETFHRAGIEDVTFSSFICDKKRFNYRNKQEFGFWGDEKGLHLAHYIRGTYHKQMVQGSLLAQDRINVAARDVRDELCRLEVWAGKLKTLVLRCNSDSEVVGALFLKNYSDLEEFKLPKSLKGLDIYFSDPKSPASIPTKRLYSLGDIKLMDTLKGVNITYDVLSFFQVNLPVFKLVLNRIDKIAGGSRIIDMYSGVGTIGLCIQGTELLVESNETNAQMARNNASEREIKVVQASSEDALSYIEANHTVIVDPPRAGLHRKLVDQLLKVKPKMIVYLSCNPSTQARDVALLRQSYDVVSAQGYNFFPSTPHIESLVILKRN